MTDVEKALFNPSEVFNTPEEVLEARDISRGHKIEILRRWEYDIKQLQVAEEENMVGPRINMLDRIINALRELDRDAGLNPEKSPPTKYGGR